MSSTAALSPVTLLKLIGFAIGPYFALLSDTVPIAQRSFASGIMFLFGGTGMLSYLLFAAPRIFGVAILIICFCCIPFVKTYSTLLFFVIIAGAGYGIVRSGEEKDQGTRIKVQG